jgi:hypothetical protein
VVFGAAHKTNTPHKTYTPNGGEGEQVSQV